MIEKLLAYNQHWSGLQKLSDDTYFQRLRETQNPEYLWIGCADSRVPAEALLGLKPGQLFVHRNVANQIKFGDSNSMSVLQFAVEVLKVKHIIVCGHSECGGIKAALQGGVTGYLEDWLQDIKVLADEGHEKHFCDCADDRKLELLTEMNVRQQVKRIAEHLIVQNAWKSGQQLGIHGWVFVINEGLIKDLDVSISGTL